MRARFFSLKYKFLLFSLLLVTSSLALLGVAYYHTAARVITEKVSLSNLNTVRQISSNIGHILQAVHETSLHLFQNPQLRAALKSEQDAPADVAQRDRIALTQFLLNYISLNPYIDSIRIWGADEMIASTDAVGSSLDPVLRQAILDRRGGLLWRLDGWRSLDGSYRNYVSLYRGINDFNHISSRLGVMMINIREDTFYAVYRDARISEHGSFYLIDDSYRLVSTLRREAVGTRIPSSLIRNAQGLRGLDGYFATRIDGRERLITYSRVPEANWWLINDLLLSDLVVDARTIRRFIVVAVAAGLVVCFVLTYLFVFRMLDPLMTMGLLMKDIEKNDFRVRLPADGNDEIALLSDTFNKMSERLKELMTQVYAVRIKQREAELMALEAQINPHFLYNSMDTIYWSSLMEDATETAHLVKALASLFRLSINSGFDVTSLRNEVDHLRNFMTIEKARYEDMIDFDVQVDEELLDCRVVKLVLQPLVENAIHHGIQKTGRHGTITVCIYRQEESLVYRVSDDGAGADQEELNALLHAAEDENRGFCIKNVNDRIKLHFGEEYGLSFASSVGRGTTATVRQPRVVGSGHAQRVSR